MFDSFLFFITKKILMVILEKKIKDSIFILFWPSEFKKKSKAIFARFNFSISLIGLEGLVQNSWPLIQP